MKIFIPYVQTYEKQFQLNYFAPTEFGTYKENIYIMQIIVDKRLNKTVHIKF